MCAAAGASSQTVEGGRSHVGAPRFPAADRRAFSRQMRLSPTMIITHPHIPTNQFADQVQLPGSQSLRNLREGQAFFGSRWKYSRMVWHLFVLAGSVCHFIAVYAYVLPRAI